MGAGKWVLIGVAVVALFVLANWALCALVLWAVGAADREYAQRPCDACGRPVGEHTEADYWACVDGGHPVDRRAAEVPS